MRKQKNDPAYHNYGGRGITVCAEWHDSETFIEWLESIGYRVGLDLDRRNNNKGYYPENCHAVTRKQNSRNRRDNRRFLVNGKELLLVEISEQYGVLPDTFLNRVFKQHRSCEDALVRHGKIDIRTERRKAKLQKTNVSG